MCCSCRWGCPGLGKGESRNWLHLHPTGHRHEVSHLPQPKERTKKATKSRTPATASPLFHMEAGGTGRPLRRRRSLEDVEAGMPSPEGSPTAFGPSLVQQATEEWAAAEATAAGTSGCSAAASGTGSFEAFQAAIAAMQQAVLEQRQGAQPQPAGSTGLVPGALGQINGEVTPEQQSAAASADRAT